MDGAHNGRIYDSKLGRFLQADPNVQAPDNSQNLNRYSYVLNNPLSYTDPSGFFFKAIGNFVGKYWRQLVAVGIGIVTAGIASGAIWASLTLNSAAAFGVAVAGGALAGYVSTGTLNGALIGAFSAAAFYGVGSYFDGLSHSNGLSSAKATAEAGGGALDIVGSYAANASLNSVQQIGKVIAHGVTGGVMSKLSGGRFAHGFASAGTTQAFAKTIGDIGDGGRSFGITAARVTSAAIVGGAASELSGGKFANGAVTGAFSRAFNDELHDASDEARFRRAGLSDDEIAGLEGETNSTILPSLPQGMVDIFAGLGDGAFKGITLGFGDLGSVRTALSIDGGVNTDTAAYGVANIAGAAIGGAPAALRTGAFLGGTKTFRFLNQNRYIRIGPSVISRSVGRTRFNYGPGRNIPMLRISNGTPNNLNHLDLRVLGR